MNRDDDKTPAQKLATEIEALKAMAPAEALEIIQTGKAMAALEARAKTLPGGSVSLLRFSDHWKVAFGTPSLEDDFGHLEVAEMTPYPTVTQAALKAIKLHRRWDATPLERCEVCGCAQLAGVKCGDCGVQQVCSPNKRQGVCCVCRDGYLPPHQRKY